jgi:hypothetical protein
VNPAISPPVAAKLRDLVAQLDAAAAAARSAADAAKGNAVTQWWQDLAGTDSASVALDSLAHAAANLADATRGRVERLRDDAEALQLLREAAAARWADLGDLDALARSLTLGGAVRDVAVASAKDAGRVVLDTVESAGNIGRLLLWVTPLLPYLLAAFLLWRSRAALRKAFA